MNKIILSKTKKFNLSYIESMYILKNKVFDNLENAILE